jgi:hypothetical protein
MSWQGREHHPKGNFNVDATKKNRWSYHISVLLLVLQGAARPSGACLLSWPWHVDVVPCYFRMNSTYVKAVCRNFAEVFLSGVDETTTQSYPLYIFTYYHTEHFVLHRGPPAICTFGQVVLALW